MKASLLAVLLLAAAPAASGSTVWAGNGALTIGVNPKGGGTTCRWPGPGGPNHLVSQPEALSWGIRSAGHDEINWLQQGQTTTNDAWPLLTTTQKDASGLAISQSLYVHPEKDILAASVILQGSATPPELYWHAAFAPCTRQVPEVPILNDLFHAYDGFAIYTTDGKTFFHFRPKNPGSQEWQTALKLATGNLPRDTWNSFGAGVWIACASPNTVAGYQCSANAPLAQSRAMAQSRTLESNAAAAGDNTNCLIALTPTSGASGHQATVYTAFGSTREDAAQTLQYALDRGDAFQNECQQWWERHLARATLPKTYDAALLAQCRRDIITLTLATARQSGAIMRGPLDAPAGRLDWPQDGAFINYALDLAGYTERAGKQLQSYAAAIRRETHPGTPAGSMPLALQSDGTDGIPAMALQPAAAAWALAAMWRHATFLDDESRRRTLTSLWDPVRLAADFLTRWADGRNKEPLPAFDIKHWRDTKQPDVLLTSYMGIDSALKIAAAIGQTPPEEWKQRTTELDVLIRLRHVGEGWQWNSDTLLPFWYDEFAATKLPDWAPIITQRLNKAAGQHSLDDLCDAALIYKNNLQLLRTLAPLLTPPPTPDALAAAQHLIVAILTMSP